MKLLKIMSIIYSLLDNIYQGSQVVYSVCKIMNMMQNIASG